MDHPLLVAKDENQVYQRGEGTPKMAIFLFFKKMSC